MSVSVPYAPRKKRGFLEDGSADFLVVIDAEDFARHGLDAVPRIARGGKDVASAFNCP
jgi:hypothetical protein